MKISVSVKPNAKRESVERLPSGEYRVAVKAPPVDGKANAALIALLAKHLGVPKSAISVRSGASGRKKWVEIME